MRYQMNEKISMKLSIYLPSILIFGIYMKNCKLFIGTGDAKHESTEFLFPQECTIEQFDSFDTLIQDKGRKISFW